MVTHCRRHTAQQCRYFGTGQSVTVDVVNEEQYVATFTVFVFFVTEVFGHSQTGQSNAQTVARRFVHLAIHHGYFIQYVGIFHLVVEVVTFTGTFTHTCEHGQTAVRFGDVVDQFHHVHGFAHTGTTEQTYFTALSKRTQQVDHFNTGFQQFGS
ncbi:cellobiose phosphorylase [Mycobacteroides abscessus subsp. massiliense]|nr:cellobiose phosphorylase [Mycobacteroides abscessus subsp. massiliense]